jgi:hypothetical protein
MRNFNKLFPVLLGLFFGTLSTPSFAGSEGVTNNDLSNGTKTARYALSEINLKSTLEFTSLPVSENWDADPAPVGWTYFTNSADGTVVVQSSTYNSPDYAVDLSNSSDETSDFIIVSPGTTLSPSSTRVKFYAKANTMFPQQMIKVGIMTDPSDPATYVNLENKPLTSNWAEYIVDMSSTPPQSGTYYIALKANFDGTNKHIYVDDFVWEEIPTGPVFQATPSSFDYGTVMLGMSSAEVDYTLTNYGIGTLNVTDISLTGTDAADFTITNISETLPFDLLANSANTMTVTVQFTPAAAGTKTASIDVTANTEVNSIPVNGECFDPTIYTLPWSENFDALTIPEFPMGWSVIANSTSSYAYYETATGGFSPDNCIKGYNSSDYSPEFYAITPPTSIDISTSRIRFQAKGDGSIKFGTITDPTDAATFTEINTFTLNSSWEEHILDLDTETSTGTYYLAFKAEFTGSYDYVYIDNVTWMEIPTTPIAELNPETYDFGEIAQNATLNSGMAFTLRNGGVGDLTVTSVTGLDGTEFSITDIDLDTVLIPALESRTFGIAYHPVDGGADAATLSIETNGGTVTTDLTGSAYVLPDGMIEIGWGNSFDQSLPMEPFYGYSYSQSIYLQSEINVAGSKITKVYYRKNDSDLWTDAGQIRLYIGHTTQSELTDWIPLSELTEVHYEEALPAGDANGWVEFILTEPFIYNNVDNLVVAFDENKSQYDNSDDDFYNHAVANNMSIYYYNDSNNPDPASPPSGTLKAYRPNIRFQFEEMPTTPTPITEPEMWNAGMRPVGYSVTSETFTITNEGTDPLTVSAITDLSGGPFSTTMVPADVNLDLAMSYEFTFTFAPTATGTFEETFIIETNGINDTVMLYGTCDYSLPTDLVEIGWDTDAGLTPNLPMEPSAVFSYSQSVYKQSEIDRDGQAVYKLFYHQTTTTSQDDPVKVYMAHYSNDNLESGWEILGNLVQVYDGTFGTQDADGWVEITLDNPFIYNNTDNLLIAFDDNGDNAYLTTDGFFQSVTTENTSRLMTNNVTDIDPATISGGNLIAQRPNIRMVFGAPPTTPIFNLNLSSWDAGMVPGNQTGYSGDVFKISNTGGGTLTITDAVLLNGTEFATTLVAADVNLAGGEEHYFSFSYSPIDVGTDADTLVITHADGSDTIFLSGYADYVLPENMVEIGQGTITDVALPMEPFYGYSYSQSIYLQSEINMDGMRISKVYYQKNNQNDWPDAGQINIYIGHTSQTNISDWIDISTLQEVTYSEALPMADENGWVEFILTTPFIYNNTDNLVIAFDENKQNYDESSDDFYNHAVAENMSIYYYNDSNNPDPTSPPSGTLKMNRPNIRLQFEDLPTTPIFSINPDAHDYGTVIVSNTATEDFTVQNNGINILTINDIYLGGTNMDQFALNGLPTFPADLTNDFADAFTFNADFAPTADGAMTAKIYIDHSEGLDSVMLTGIAYDATIYAIPWDEYFDDPATTTTPDMTLGWNAIMNASSTWAWIRTGTSTTMSSPNSVGFYNSSDMGGDFILAAPPTSLDPTGTRVRFYANGGSSHQIQVGYLTIQDDASTFVPVDTVDLTGSYTQFTSDMSAAAPTGTWYIGFKVIFNSTYNYIYIDNVVWEEIPTTPVFSALPSSIDFGNVPMMGNAGPENIVVSNTGIGELIIETVELSGADATEFSINVVDDLADTITNTIGDNLTVEVSFLPTTEGVKTAEVIFTDDLANTYNVAITGTGVDVTMYPDTTVNFDDAVVPPPYWTEGEGMLADPVEFTATSGAWTSDDFSNDGSYTQSARLNIWSTNTNDWLITTPIYLGDGTNPTKLEFDLSTTPYSGTGEAGAAPDDRFAVVISTDNGATWSEANVLRLWDNQGSEYVYDDIPNGDGQHVEISLSDYTGYVKIALYGESTVGNADNNLFVDNFSVIMITPEEIALEETVDSTSIIATPPFINFVENIDEERVIDYAVNFPSPFNPDLEALLLHDYMIEFGTALPTGVTVDVEYAGINMGQIASDGVQTAYWVSDVISQPRPALNSMNDITVTLKVNGLVDIGSYDLILKSYTALAGEFDDANLRTLLADATSTLNVTPTPLTLPIEEDFAAGLPANWSTTNNGTDGAEWTYVTDGLLMSTTGDNGYMQINDFDAGATAITNADLMTPSIDMSTVTGLVMLDFEHHYDHFTVDSATLLISTDNGMSWTQIEMFDVDEGAMDVPTAESYDITAYAAGQENVIIRWNFNDGGAQTFDWNVDDVHIYEVALNNEAEILTFDITGQLSSEIDAGAATVNVVMPEGTDLSTLIPIFSLSEGATAAVGGVDQVSGTSEVNFNGSVTLPVVYTVTAENGTTTKEWYVSVSTNININGVEGFNFSVYPNPSNGEFDMNVYSENGFTYSIYSADGKLISTETVKASGEFNQRINLKGYAPGFYTLKVEADDTTKVEKLVIE